MGPHAPSSPEATLKPWIKRKGLALCIESLQYPSKAKENLVLKVVPQ